MSTSGGGGGAGASGRRHCFGSGMHLVFRFQHFGLHRGDASIEQVQGAWLRLLSHTTQLG